MKKVSIPLPEKVIDALRAYAWSQDREPARQAERYIREGLIRDGALPAPTGSQEAAHGTV